MGNFRFLKNDPQFSTFAEEASMAEMVYNVDPATCVMGCRRAMDFAVKWMYSADSCLVMPLKDTLVSLINTDSFKNIVGRDLFKRLDFIRRVGNNANNNSYAITKAQVAIALENLHAFMDFIAYCYGSAYEKTTFDIHRAEQQSEKLLASHNELNFEQLYKNNKLLQDEFTDRRKTKEKSYEAKPLDLTKAQTRKAYIDVMLTSLGWQRGVGWIDDFPIEGMPNKPGFGVADYVLLDDYNNPMAVVKKNSIEIPKKHWQVDCYATEYSMGANMPCNRNCKPNCMHKCNCVMRANAKKI